MINEKCSICGSTDFAVVRDTTSRRNCKCGNSWECPPKSVVGLMKKYDALLAQAEALAKELEKRIEVQCEGCGLTETDCESAEVFIAWQKFKELT